MGRWHRNLSPVERIWRKLIDTPEMSKNAPKKYPGRDFYEQFIGTIVAEGICDPVAQQTFIIELASALCHDEFIKYQRPTYLLTKELIETAKSFELSAEDLDFALEKVPYPCFALMFEKGSFFIELDKNIKPYEVVSVFVCDYGSNLSEQDQLILGPSHRQLIVNTVESPYPAVHGYDYKTTYAEIIKRCPEYDAVIRLLAALMMLWRSRPHMVQNAETTITKDERRYIIGDRKNVRTWVFPTEIKVTKPSEHPATFIGQREAHWRAGHFRHYRHERYEREPDGSVVIKFIDPCFVGLATLKNNSCSEMPEV